MEAADVPSADVVAWTAMAPLWPQELQPTGGDEALRIARRQARITHLLTTDPGGAWIAENDSGATVGVANALRREQLWGLSLLAVASDHQGHGIGIRLMERVLAYAEPDRARIIVSSRDPRALRAYHRAGLAIHPTVDGIGAVNRSRIPAGLRSVAGDLAVDGERIDAVARHVRGAHYGTDLDTAIAGGCSLLVCGDDGFALERDGAPYLVAARSTAAATDLVWSCLALADPGATVCIGSIMGGNDWAIAVALDAGFTLSSEGAVFSDGITGTMAPFIPSGAYL